MKKVISLSLFMVLGLSLISGCDVIANNPTNSTINQSQNNVPNNFAPPNPDNGMRSNMPNQFGNGLNLTTEQQDQILQLRQDTMPQEIDSSKMDQVKTAIKESFSLDTFSSADLKTKLSTLSLITDVNLDTQADIILKTYNILTTEQQNLLDGSSMMLFNSRPQGSFRINLRSETIETLSSSLYLTAEQKTSLESIMQPSDMAPPNFENNDSLITELKTGKATKESIANILKTSNSSIIQESELDMLSKIHALLNSEQRTKFIDTIDFNAGGPNGMPMPNMQPRF